MAGKPSIFVSSTIHDFKDLRSAIRYYLASLGYDVFLSEFNDFPKPLDANTFEAALETLRCADFYILLIGSRVGGFYAEQQGISITRKEYRTAYELAKEGHMRLALFVRDEIWALRKDRNALRDYLINDFTKNRELSNDEIDKLVDHPGPLANNPELLFDFINEIAREEEMKAAIRKEGEFPAANWVHSYSNFEDIVDVLRVQLGIMTHLSTIALKSNLRRELLENLVLITEKHDGQVSTTYTWAAFARKQLKGVMNDQSQLPGRYLRWALMYSITVSRGENMSTRFVDQALQSGEFLEYRPDHADYVSGWFNERLFQLRDRIERFRSSIDGFRDPISNFITKYRELAKTEEEVAIPNQDLVFPLALADMEKDIVLLSIALLRALDGDDRLLPSVELNPPTPLFAEAERIREETPTLEEIREWIKTQLGEG
jgi:hypothetical protein